MLGIPVELITANAVEWAVHKFILHDMGKKPDTFWSFHFHEHHMGHHPGANWCVTKPWFDYLMGTRVFGKTSLRESNILGLQGLPEWLNNRLAPERFSRPRVT